MKLIFFRVQGLFVFVFATLIFIFATIPESIFEKIYSVLNMPSFFYKVPKDICGNLYLKFIAISVLIIFAFLLIYHLLLLIIYKKKKVKIISIHYDNCHPFTKCKIYFEIERKPLLMPSIFFLLKFCVNEKNNMLETKILPIQSSRNKGNTVLTATFQRHGNFFLNNFQFIIRDILGFTEFRIDIPFEYHCKIMPHFLREVEIPFSLDQGGDKVIQSVIKIDSTDYFESRKYYPGDDTRRINWKLFAHINELHVRDVEKTPPKFGKINILFAPYSENIYEYEYITSLFLSTIYFLLENNFEINILSPFSKKSCLLDQKGEGELLEIINNSYLPFTYFDATFSGGVIFASIEEYSKILPYKMVEDNFSIITSYEQKFDRKKLVRSLFSIDHNDNIFREILRFFNNYKSSQVKNKFLEEQKRISLSKNVKLEVFTIDNTIFGE